MSMTNILIWISVGTTREHLGLALALKVPIFIVVSKVDLCTKATVERTVRQLERVLKQPGCNKVPLVVSTEDDAVTAAQQFTQSPRYREKNYCTYFVKIDSVSWYFIRKKSDDCSGSHQFHLYTVDLFSITPIFTLSSVTGENLELLKVFFNILPPLSNSKEQEELMQQLTEFQVHMMDYTVYYS